MIRRVKSLGVSLIAALFIFAGGSVAAADLARPPLDEDRALAVRYITGIFDNYEQLYWEKALGVPEELHHRQVTSTYVPVTLPEFGDVVIYADKYWDGDPNKVAYRNLYLLTTDEELDAVRLRLLTIPDNRRLDGALDDLSLLDQLTPEEMIAMDLDCDTVFKRWGNMFKISMIGECWLTTVHPSGAPVSITVETTLDARDFWVLSYGYGEDGSQMYGPLDLVPSKERKARPFACTLTVGDGDDGEYFGGLKLHDQGGSATVTTRTLGDVRLRLRQVTWPVSNQRSQLALFVLREGQDEVLLEDASGNPAPYASASPAARSIALNLPDIQASCRYTRR